MRRCGGFLWSTGERLRSARIQPLPRGLHKGAHPAWTAFRATPWARAANENGTAPKNLLHRLRRPLRWRRSGTRGHMGDVAIWSVCGPVLRGGWILPEWMWWAALGVPGRSAAAPASCPSDQQKPGFQCCPRVLPPDAGGQCKPWCPNGDAIPRARKSAARISTNATYNPNNPAKLRCIGGAAPKPGKGILGCLDKSPVFSPPVCQTGWSKQTSLSRQHLPAD